MAALSTCEELCSQIQDLPMSDTGVASCNMRAIETQIQGLSSTVLGNPSGVMRVEEQGAEESCYRNTLEEEEEIVPYGPISNQRPRIAIAKDVMLEGTRSNRNPTKTSLRFDVGIAIEEDEEVYVPKKKNKHWSSNSEITLMRVFNNYRAKFNKKKIDHLFVGDTKKVVGLVFPNNRIPGAISKLQSFLELRNFMGEHEFNENLRYLEFFCQFPSSTIFQTKLKYCLINMREQACNQRKQVDLEWDKAHDEVVAIAITLPEPVISVSKQLPQAVKEDIQPREILKRNIAAEICERRKLNQLVSVLATHNAYIDGFFRYLVSRGDWPAVGSVHSDIKDLRNTFTVTSRHLKAFKRVVHALLSTHKGEFPILFRKLFSNPEDEEAQFFPEFQHRVKVELPLDAIAELGKNISAQFAAVFKDSEENIYRTVSSFILLLVQLYVCDDNVMRALCVAQFVISVRIEKFVVSALYNLAERLMSMAMLCSPKDEVAQSDVDVKETTQSFVYSFIEAMVSFIGGSVETVQKHKHREVLLMGLTFFGAFRGLREFLTFLSETLVRVHANLYYWYTGQHYIPTVLQTQVPELNAWMDETCEILKRSPTQADFNNDAELREAVARLYETGLIIDRKLVGHDIRVYIRPFNMAFGVIKELFECVQTTRRIMETHMQPLSIWLTGAPGIGKTTITYFFTEYFCKERGYDPKTSYYARRVGDSNFWDNYEEQRVVFYDDIFQRDIAQYCALEATELISVINEAPYMIPRAELREKGKNYCKAELVVLTSNITTLPQNHGLKDPDAFHRRINLKVHVTLKEQYKDKKGRLDAQYIYTRDENGIEIQRSPDLSYYEFLVVEPDGTSHARLGISGVLALFIQKMQQQRARRSDIAGTMRDMMSNGKFDKVIASAYDKLNGNRRRAGKAKEEASENQSVEEDDGAGVFPRGSANQAAEIGPSFRPTAESEAQGLITGAFTLASYYVGAVIGGTFGYLHGQEKKVPPDMMIHVWLHPTTDENAFYNNVKKNLRCLGGIHYSVNFPEMGNLTVNCCDHQHPQAIMNVKVTSMIYAEDIANSSMQGYVQYEGAGMDFPCAIKTVTLSDRAENPPDAIALAYLLALIVAKEPGLIAQALDVRWSWEKWLREWRPANSVATFGLVQYLRAAETLLTIAAVYKFGYWIYGQYNKSYDEEAHVSPPPPGMGPAKAAHQKKVQKSVQERKQFREGKKGGRTHRKAFMNKKMYSHSGPFDDEQAHTMIDVDQLAPLRNNLVDLCWKSDTTACANAGFGVKDRFLLTTSHTLRLFDHDDIETSGTLTINLRDGKKYVLTPDQFRFWSLPNRDLVLLEILDRTFPMFRNVIYLFHTDETLYDDETLKDVAVMYGAKDSIIVKIENPGFRDAAYRMGDGKLATVQECVTGTTVTRKGFCGAPWFSYDGLPRILGLHIAGGQYTSTAVTITKEELEMLLEAAMLEEEAQGLTINLAPGLKRVPNVMNWYNRIQTDSTIRPSLLWHSGVTRVPRALRPFRIGTGELVHPLANAINKGVHEPWPQKPEAALKKSELREISLMMGANTTGRSVLTDEEIVNGGFDGKLGPIEPNTSAGVKWRTPQSIGKRDYMKMRNGKWIIEPGPKGDPWKEMHRLEGILRGNDPIPHHEFPVTMFLKDELGSIDKRNAGDTRKICGASLEVLMLQRKYLGVWIAHVHKNFLSSPIAVGINVHSNEWDVMWSKLIKTDWQYFAGDFKGFDSTVPSWLVSYAMYVINAWYGDVDSEAAHIRMRLVEMLVHYQFSVFDAMIQASSYGPSGWPATAEFNSLIVLVMMCIMFRKITGLPIHRVYEFVRWVIYGDDHVVSVHPYIPQFNAMAISQLSKELFGMSYTDARKKEYDHPWDDFDTIVFLKRSYRKVGALVFAPLEPEIIDNMVCWISKRGDPVEATVQIAIAALHEWFHHGPDVFNAKRREYIGALQGKVHSFSCDPIYHLSYDELMYKFINCINFWEMAYEPIPFPDSDLAA